MASEAWRMHLREPNQFQTVEGERMMALGCATQLRRPLRILPRDDFP
jgi:hypothetical protein